VLVTCDEDRIGNVPIMTASMQTLEEEFSKEGQNFTRAGMCGPIDGRVCTNLATLVPSFRGQI
jgi:hypothetical protein